MSGTIEMAPAVALFWAAFLDRIEDAEDARARWYDVFSIGDDAAAADAGARLILTGAKTATSSLLWEYEASGARPPFEGALSILLDGKAVPICVVETT